MTQSRQAARPGRELPAEYREVADRLVRDQGWSYIHKGGGGHPVLRDPKGCGQTPVPTTPSDNRSFENWLRQLRALGADLAPAATSRTTHRRRRAAAANVAAHEEMLAALDAELSTQPHTPYRPRLVTDEQVTEFVARSTEESGVPLRVEDPTTLAQIATLMGAAREIGQALRRPAAAQARPAPKPQLVPSWQELEDVKELLAQGYHADRVATRTGLPREAFRHLVADDGYAR